VRGLREMWAVRGLRGTWVVTHNFLTTCEGVEENVGL
jgi:hypothetical protein